VSVATALARVDQLSARLALLQPPAGSAPSAAASTFTRALQRATSTPQTDTTATEPFAQEIRAAAEREGLDPALVRAVVKHESGFDPRATSRAGAMGLMQLMPATARSLGVDDPYDPGQSLAGGTRFLRQLLERFEGDVRLAVAAYNAGPGAVDRYRGVPPYAETRAYVTRVLDTYQAAIDERRST
jgi:soluble lytic murein transglycosylase-like protein